jgi:hypothetical protein
MLLENCGSRHVDTKFAIVGKDIEKIFASVPASMSFFRASLRQTDKMPLIE